LIEWELSRQAHGLSALNHVENFVIIKKARLLTIFAIQSDWYG